VDKLRLELAPTAAASPYPFDQRESLVARLDTDLPETRRKPVEELERSCSITGERQTSEPGP